MKEFFKVLLAVLFPEPKRNNCPHCGGGKCYGACSVAQEGEENPERALAPPPQADENSGPDRRPAPDTGSHRMP